MRILITNDDGIKSPGLKALKDAFAEHEVWVVAPDKEQSGQSHSITFRKPVCFEPHGEREFACDGSPADCVMYSSLGAIPVKPDIVVSGINLGANLGTDLIFSGTAAAARQAALMGIPGIAVSVDTFFEPFYFKGLADFVAGNLELITKLWHPDHFININGPNQSTPYSGVKVTSPSRRNYRDSLMRFDAPRGGSYFFLKGDLDKTTEPGTDADAVANGYISISPVFLHPQNRSEEEAYLKADFK